MDEQLQIVIKLQIDAFVDDPAVMQLELSATLTSEQRGYVHNYVRFKGLKSRSTGKGADRSLTLFKPDTNTTIDAEAMIRMSIATRQLCQQLHDGPHRAQPHDLLQLSQFGRSKPPKSSEATSSSKAAAAAATATTTTTTTPRPTVHHGSGRLPRHSHDFPQPPQPPPAPAQQSSHSTSRPCSMASQFKISIPPARQQPSVHDATRANLPIFGYRQQLLEQLNTTQVLVVSGDTGSGKTTQMPQYLLEECHQRQQLCRIICTQPRRLAAISIADRVAQERGEQLGHTVGYQIRLESRVSQTSNLIYTTSGFLLRCLIAAQSELFNSLTHIILDEVHERERYTDFLLIAIKDALVAYPQLKIILMSATIDSDVFTRYFGACPLVDIPGRMFPVRMYNLEQTLALIGFTNDKVAMFRRQADQLNGGGPQQRPQAVAAVTAPPRLLDKDMQDYVDEVLEECLRNSEDGFHQFLYLVTGEAVPVDTQHSETLMSALMQAASMGFVQIVGQLLALGADPLLKGAFDLAAIDFARMHQHDACVAVLQQAMRNASAGSPGPQAAAELELANNQILLKAYQHQRNADELDYELMARLVEHVLRNSPADDANGAILVFLPGYDGIVELNEALLQRMSAVADVQPMEIFMLHGSMQAQDQKRVFAPAQRGHRKVILSTNIAETSLTIDDVVYVIDTGLVKQKSFDALTGATTLTATCISQACAKQRMGRAGRVRPGVCFRLYSQLRFDTMERFTLPEILRVPLAEIALSARIMCGNRSSIAEFLAKAIQPPPAASVAQAIALLKRMGALDELEECTQLGRLLSDLPLDVQLGKALLYAVVLRCLDPVLTIVTALSVKQPFVLPMGGEAEALAKQHRRTLANDSCSDHMTLLRVYQRWTESKAANCERQFCRENFVSSGTMQMICGMRSQILGLMRSLGLIQHRSPGNIAELNRNADNWAAVKACLTAGLYPNVCRIDRQRGQLKSREMNKLMIHHNSVLRQKNPKRMAEDLRALPSEWVLFEEMSWVGASCMVRWNTVVSPVCVALFAGAMFMPVDWLEPVRDEDDGDAGDSDAFSCSDDGDGVNGGGLAVALPTENSRFVVDDWIRFVMDTGEARLLHHLRQRLNVVLMKVIAQPQKCTLTAGDQQCVEAVCRVLDHEDRFCGLKQQSDVGRRPIAVKIHMAAAPAAQQQSADMGKFFTLTRGASSGAASTSKAAGNSRNSRYQAASAAAPLAANSNWRNARNDRSDGDRLVSPVTAAAPAPGQRSITGRVGRLRADTARFFIVHASSELQVQQHFREPTVWCWTKKMLSELLILNYVSLKDLRSVIANRMLTNCFPILPPPNKQRMPTIDVVLFFYIPSQGRFYGAAKFSSNPDSYRTESLSQRSVSADRLRSIWYKPVDVRPTTTFDACQHGEEITDRKAARMLLDHFA